MISGDRSILQGKKGAFWYTLQELSKHWERIDIITPPPPHQSRSSSRVAPRGSDAGQAPGPLPPAHSTGSTSSPQAGSGQAGERGRVFENVFFHPSSRGLWYQPWWILIKGAELIKEHHHNVMTVHDYPPFYNGLGARWLHRAMNIPYMTEIHHIVGYPRAASLSEWIGYWMSRTWLPRWGTDMATAVRVVSGETWRVLQSWEIPLKKFFVQSSIYLDYSALKPDPSIAKQYDCVFCGRLVPNKGLDNILKAIAGIPKATLLVIGDGPERKRCEKLAESLGIKASVIFTGWLPTQADVYRALQSGKIFVMNSVSEGGPRVLFEAMALGMPVISTRVGSAPQFIGDGHDGLLTNGDPNDLREKITMLLQNDQMRLRLGAAARHVLDVFDRASLVKTYADSLTNIATTHCS